MTKNTAIITTISVVALAAIGGIIYLNQRLGQERDSRQEETAKVAKMVEENKQLQELAELDKAEMEEQYQQFERQYEELQNQLRNDSLIAQIDIERRRTQQLLEELRRTKATDIAEITRLKKEIASLRAVLRDYLVQIDSLNRSNEALRVENTTIRQQYTEASSTISNISEENTKLKDKVDKAAQLDATGFWVKLSNKRGKDAKKAKDLKTISFGFNIVKNVTASNGERVIYARILKPDNSVLKTSNGTFKYENTELDYSIKKVIEYTGEEQAVTLYWNVNEYFSPGNYKIFIFCDSQMIGKTSFDIK